MYASQAHVLCRDRGPVKREPSRIIDGLMEIDS